MSRARAAAAVLSTSGPCEHSAFVNPAATSSGAAAHESPGTVPTRAIGALPTRGPRESLFWCYGPFEHGLKSFIDSLIAERVAPEFRDLNVLRMEGKEAAADELCAQCATSPFFGDYRVVLVVGAEGIPVDQQATIAHWLDAGLPDGLTLAFLSLQDKPPRGELFPAIERHGTVRQFVAPQRAALRDWLRQQLREAGISLSREAGEFLIERDGGETSALAADVEKLGLRWLGEARMLGVSDVRDLVGGVPEHGVFAMLDQVSLREGAKAIRSLGLLLDEGEAAQSVLAIVVGQLRLMLYCRCLAGRRVSPDDIAAMVGPQVRPAGVRMAMERSRNYSEDDLVSALISLGDLDAATKSGTVRHGLGVSMDEGLRLVLARIAAR